MSKKISTPLGILLIVLAAVIVGVLVWQLKQGQKTEEVKTQKAVKEEITPKPTPPESELEKEDKVFPQVTAPLNLKTTKLATIPEKYREVKRETVVFSPDGRKVAYVVGDAKQKEKMFIVVGDKEGKKYDAVGNPVFSPDSQEIAYWAADIDWATQTGKAFIVIGGKEGKKYDSVIDINPVFSPDSSKVAYIAEQEGKMFVVVGDKEGKKYDSVGGDPDSLENPVFSPDSSKVAFRTRVSYWYKGEVTHKREEFIVVDGKEGKKYDFVGDPVFSPNSQKIAFWAVPEFNLVTQRGESFIVINGKEGKKYDDFLRNPVFSPDSSKVAYVVPQGELGGKSFVVVGNKEGKQYDSVLINPIIVFSPDSSKVAYVVTTVEFFDGGRNMRIGKSFVVVDGKEGKKYDIVGKPVFSPDSRYLAYGAKDDRELWWIVEEVE